MRNPWLVLDLETEGLDPEHDRILECSAIWVDRDLTELAVFDRVSGWPSIPPLRPIVQEMHTRNGLLAEVLSSPNPGHQLDQALLEWAMKCGLSGIQLIGNSIHFDRAFLVRYCPAFCTLLHHRMIDVSSLNVLEAAWAPARPGYPKGGAHRALTDCRESLAQLRHYKKLLWGAEV